MGNGGFAAPSRGGDAAPFDGVFDLTADSFMDDHPSWQAFFRDMEDGLINDVTLAAEPDRNIASAIDALATVLVAQTDTLLQSGAFTDHFDRAVFALGSIFLQAPLFTLRDTEFGMRAIKALGNAMEWGWMVNQAVAKFAAHALCEVVVNAEEWGIPLSLRVHVADQLLHGLLHWLQGARQHPEDEPARSLDDQPESICDCSCVYARNAATCWLDNLFKSPLPWLEAHCRQSEFMRPLVMELLVSIREENSNPFVVVAVLLIPRLVWKLVVEDPLVAEECPRVTENAVATAAAFKAAADATTNAFAAVEWAAAHVWELPFIVDEGGVAARCRRGDATEARQRKYDEATQQHDSKHVNQRRLARTGRMLADLRALMPSGVAPAADCAGTSGEASFADTLISTLTYGMVTVQDSFFSLDAMRVISCVVAAWAHVEQRRVDGVPAVLHWTEAELNADSGFRWALGTSRPGGEWLSQPRVGAARVAAFDRELTDSLHPLVELHSLSEYTESVRGAVARLLRNPCSVLLLENVACCAHTETSARQLLRIVALSHPETALAMLSHQIMHATTARDAAASTPVADRVGAEGGAEGSVEGSADAGTTADAARAGVARGSVGAACAGAAGATAGAATSAIAGATAGATDTDAVVPSAATASATIKENAPLPWPSSEDWFMTWDDFRLKLWADLRGATALSLVPAGDGVVLPGAALSAVLRPIPSSASIPPSIAVVLTAARNARHAALLGASPAAGAALSVSPDAVDRRWPKYTWLAYDVGSALGALEEVDVLSSAFSPSSLLSRDTNFTMFGANVYAAVAVNIVCREWRRSVIERMRASDIRIWLHRTIQTKEAQRIEAEERDDPEAEEPLAFIESDRSGGGGSSGGNPSRVFEELFDMYKTRTGLWDDVSGQVEVRFKDEIGSGSALLREWLVHVSNAMLHPAANLLASRDNRQTFFVSPSAHLTDITRIPLPSDGDGDGDGDGESSCAAAPDAGAASHSMITETSEFHRCSSDLARKVIFLSMGRCIALALKHEICIGIRLDAAFCHRLLAFNVAPRPDECTDEELKAQDAAFYKYKYAFIRDTSIPELEAMGIELVFDDVLDDRGPSELRVAGAEQRVPLVPQSKRTAEYGADERVAKVAKIAKSATTKVTDANKGEYLSLLKTHRLWGTARNHTHDVLEGMVSIISPSTLRQLKSMLAPKFGSFSEMIAGLPVLDVDDWHRHTEYVGRYTASTPVVTYFWRVVRERLSESERSSLLQFATGSRHPPVGGFKMLQGFNGGLHKFSLGPLHGATSDGATRGAAGGATGGESETQRQKLPEAHSCICTMDIPEWASVDEAEKKLRMAITHGLRFDE